MKRIKRPHCTVRNTNVRNKQGYWLVAIVQVHTNGPIGFAVWT